MKEYFFKVTDWQLNFMKWVRAGAPDNETAHALLSASNFIRAVRKLTSEGFVIWNSKEGAAKPFHEIFKLTSAGDKLIDLIEDIDKHGWYRND